MRAVFPNPDKMLLPGMFVRAVLEEGVDEHAILVPQEGVSRNFRGRPQVMIVKPDNTVEQREVAAPRSIGDMWLVTEGLQPGEKVIVEGLLSIRPGMTVRPAPATNRDGGGRNAPPARQ